MTVSSGLNLQLLTRRDIDAEVVSVLVVSKHALGRDKLLQQLTQSLPEPFALHESSSQERALELVSSARPDVLILDATQGEWPEPDFCRRLGYRAAVIFVIDDRGAAQNAFDAGAIDCLLEPVHPERLARALQRALTWIAGGRSAGPAMEELPLDAAEAGGRGVRWLRIVRGTDLLVAPLNDVLYLQADRKTTRVVLERSEGFLRQGINTVANQLDPQQFVRIHRGTLVNCDHISAVEQDELGRVLVRLRGRTEKLYASRVHERALLRDGIY